ncbi:HD domain-containing protein [Nocardia sp. NPDC050712]|uniref:HD domain-containing protein n=1 Tax=Nocardia sp. NPDC050712 TaxID=3155518 RepID=UPI0033CF1BBC
MSSTTDVLALPATPLTDKADELITGALTPHLRHHSIRGFLFARAYAAAEGLSPDRDYNAENLFLICALHDIGLSDVANGDQQFEIDGADFAARFLEDNGVTDERVDIIWEGIAAHTNNFTDSPVFRRRRPAEIWIAVHGIGIDVGGSPAGLPPGCADLIHRAYPRLGGTPALIRAVEDQALPNPAKRPPCTFAGELVHQRHPDLPYPTLDMLFAHGGWDD